MKLEKLADLPDSKFRLIIGDLPEGVEADFYYISRTLEIRMNFIKVLDK
jgi:hypothetical protein